MEENTRAILEDKTSLHDNKFNDKYKFVIKLNNRAVELYKEGKYIDAVEQCKEAMTRVTIEGKKDDLTENQTIIESANNHLVSNVETNVKKQVNAVCNGIQMKNIDVYQEFHSRRNINPLFLFGAVPLPCPDESNCYLYKINDYIQAVILYNMAISKFRQGSLKIAENIMNKAISLEIHDNIHVGEVLFLKTTLWNNLGCIKYECKQFVDCLRCYEEAIPFLLSIEINWGQYYKVANRYIGIFKSNIARVLFEMNRYEEALHISQDVLKAKIEALGDDHIEVVVTGYNISLLSQKSGRMDDTFEGYSHFINHVTSDNNLCKEMCTDTVTAIMNIFSLMAYVERFDDYRDTMYLKQEMRKINETRFMYGFDHHTIPEHLHQVGSFFYDKKNYKFALPFFYEQLRVEKIYFGKTHPDLSIILERIGNIYQYQNMFELAMKYYESAKSMVTSEQSKKDQYRQIFITLNHNIGIVQIHVGKYKNALQMLSDALRSKKIHSSKNDPEVAGMYYRIGKAQFEKGILTDAMLNTLESLRIRELVFGRNHKVVGESLYLLGEIYEGNWEYNEALNVYERLLQIMKLRSEYQNDDTAQILCKIGHIHHIEGTLSEAVNSYSCALKIIKTDKDRIQYITHIIKEIACIFHEMGALDEAMDVFVTVEEIRREMGISILDTEGWGTNSSIVFMMLHLRMGRAASAA